VAVAGADSRRDGAQCVAEISLCGDEFHDAASVRIETSRL
jgi:hypothetical protein